ncbi:hypothetical protein BC827DRAFT_948426 [Russula dissimulans]|nr:hypothetical protein BC827DRAFT_948426 [Russula dissimulans]
MYWPDFWAMGVVIFVTLTGKVFCYHFLPGPKMPSFRVCFSNRPSSEKAGNVSTSTIGLQALCKNPSSWLTTSESQQQFLALPFDLLTCPGPMVDTLNACPDWHTLRRD